MKLVKIILGVAALIAIGFGIQQGNAVVNGSDFAGQHKAVVFPRIQAADTTETIRTSYALHKEITYFLNIESRHANGAMNSDTVYVKMCGSPDDSSFVNLSSTNATQKYTTEGMNSITFDLNSTFPFTRIEIPRMTDSLYVYIKAFISIKEAQ